MLLSPNRVVNRNLFPTPKWLEFWWIVHSIVATAIRKFHVHINSAVRALASAVSWNTKVVCLGLPARRVVAGAAGIVLVEVLRAGLKWY